MAKVTQQASSREGAQNQISWTPKPFPFCLLAFGVSSSLHIPHTAESPPTLGTSPLAPDKASSCLGASDCRGGRRVIPPRLGCVFWARSQAAGKHMASLLRPHNWVPGIYSPVCVCLSLGFTFSVCAVDGRGWLRWSLGPFHC